MSRTDRGDALISADGQASPPVLLIHVQQFRGTGHRARMGRLAEVLARDVQVVLLDGGPPQPRWPHPPGITVLPLTALVRDSSGRLAPWDPGLTLEEALAQRRDTLLNAAHRFRPHGLILEFYPFGRLNLASEIELLIQTVRASRSGALVLSSVRDILDTGFSDGVPDEMRSPAAIAARLRSLDGVLIHADRALCDPDASRLLAGFVGLELSGVPFAFTGFIGSADSPSPAAAGQGTRRGTVLSMGGGIDGRPLAEGVLAAWPQLMAGPAAARLQPLRLFTGPYLTRDDQEAIARRCADLQVECNAFRADYRVFLNHAALSISRFGYNTCMDILQVGVPAVVVPAPTAIPNDQALRARQFARLGRVAVSVDDGAEQILRAVDAALQGPPSFPSWRLDGAERTAAWIRRRLGGSGRPDGSAVGETTLPSDG